MAQTGIAALAQLCNGNFRTWPWPGLARPAPGNPATAQPCLRC